MLTNGPDANVTAPTNAAVGWQFVADNGPFTAMGPRLTCSVQHVGIFEPVFAGQLYHITKVIEPPSSDVRFMVLDRDIVSGYATLVTNWTGITSVWIVGGGDGTGQVVGDLYYWGGQTSQRKRWGGNTGFTEVLTCCGVPQCAITFTTCATASGDSGYAIFTGDGRYIGPVFGGENPAQLGGWPSKGKLAGFYLDWIKDYLPVPPSTPPRPKTPVSLTVHSPKDPP
jgi:hypothetical protein